MNKICDLQTKNILKLDLCEFHSNTYFEGKKLIDILFSVLFFFPLVKFVCLNLKCKCNADGDRIRYLCIAININI